MGRWAINPTLDTYSRSAGFSTAVFSKPRDVLIFPIACYGPQLHPVYAPLRFASWCGASLSIEAVLAGHEYQVRASEPWQTHTFDRSRSLAAVPPSQPLGRELGKDTHCSNDR